MAHLQHQRRVRLHLGLVATLVAIMAAVCLPASAARAAKCGGFNSGSCGVGSNPIAGDFHGVIAVHNVPWVLELSSHAGSKAGCADCSWTVLLDCHTQSASNPGPAQDCTGANNSANCHRPQLRYQLLLSTDAVTDELVGTLCLGGGVDPIPLGDHAAGDVRRYLRDVTPPNLAISTKPKAAALAGLATFFTARSPELRPAPFGDGEITETITIAPIRSDWRWGDGSRSGWTAAATTVTHTYLSGGSDAVRLSTRWGATYTITFEGQTVGPYDAVGQLTKEQRISLAVLTSTPTLVSR
jgi:hypothetical protein